MSNNCFFFYRLRVDFRSLRLLSCKSTPVEFRKNLPKPPALCWVRKPVGKTSLIGRIDQLLENKWDCMLCSDFVIFYKMICNLSFLGYITAILYNATYLFMFIIKLTAAYLSRSLFYLHLHSSSCRYINS
jgi:hypothetical protein